MNPDSAGLSRLFLEHSRSLTKYLNGIVSKAEIAEELVQEVFVRLRLSGRSELESPRGFLFRTAQNLARDYLRRAARVPMDRLDDQSAERLSGCGPSPEEVLAARQELAIVRAVLLELPPKCRRVFLLARIEGLSERAVAAEMGISQTMVRKHLARAVRHIHAGLGRSGR